VRLGRYFILEERNCSIYARAWIKELYLNSAKGWKGKELSFLATVPDLVVFSLIDFTIDDISPIHVLHSLRRLEIFTYCKTEIDFSKFPILEECSLEWRPKAKSIFACRTLKRLFLNKYSGKDTSNFSELVNLESLSIANSPIESIHGLWNLSELKFLGLYNLRKLKTLNGIENLINLEGLEVNGCRALSSIEGVKYLTKLRKLHFCNDGDIESIKPLERLQQLEEVLFYDSTNVIDGDLSPLTQLKHLRNVSFQNQPHYSHEIAELQRKIEAGAIKPEAEAVGLREQSLAG